MLGARQVAMQSPDAVFLDLELPAAGAELDAVVDTGQERLGTHVLVRLATQVDPAQAALVQLLGGSELVSFDQQVIQLLKAQKRKARLLVV